MSGSTATPAKDRKIRSALWVPPAERRIHSIVEVGLDPDGAKPAGSESKNIITDEDANQNDSDADMEISSFRVDDDIMGLLPGDITVEPPFQNNAKSDVLREMIAVLAEKVDVKSEKIKILSEKEAALAEKMDILSKMLDSVS